jgi:uncharacterized repeat protein (TIGR01451 family)
MINLGRMRIAFPGVIALLLAASSALSTDVSYYADHDSYIRGKGAEQDNNFGSEKEIKLKGKVNDLKRAMMRFDLSAIPSDAVIDSATVYLYCHEEEDDGLAVLVYRITDSWHESTVNWDSAGTDFDTTATVASFTPSDKDRYYSFDLTELVQDWVNGTHPNYGFGLFAPAQDEVKFRSKEEDGTSEDPYINITYSLFPDIAVDKIESTYSDPVHGTSNPKAIPGAMKNYTVYVTNSGSGAADDDTVFIIDAIPANTALFVNDLGGAGSGPVLFKDGAISSGLSYTFSGLASATDDLSFSSDGGVTYTYTPAADADGCDGSVTHIRVNPQGVFDAASGGGNPGFSFKFRVRVD